MSECFTIQEHIIPASFIRGSERGVRDETSAHLRLSVKQYIPRNNPEPQVGDPTIIFTHGTGITREAYEPMLEAFVRDGAFPIRSIWSIENAQNGASYLLNENVIGDAIHWFDHSRDVLHTINHFQNEMTPPLVAIGHSLGAAQLLVAALYHPRLFTSVVAIEPGVDSGFDSPVTFQRSIGQQMKSNANRRDEWPSRQEVVKRLKKSPLYASWDPRAFDLETAYGLRDVWEEPTSSDTKQMKAKTILATPKVMQIATDLCPDPPLSGYPEPADFASRYRNACIVPGFYRTEPRELFNMLSKFSGTLLYVWGEVSRHTTQQYRDEIMKTTSCNIVGDEAVLATRVLQRSVPKASHFAPMERPEVTAKLIRDWLQQERKRWLEQWERRQTQPPFSSQVNPELLARLAKI